MTTNNKTPQPEELPTNKENWLWEASDFLAGRGYWFLVVFLAGYILVVSVVTVLSIQHRHATYKQLSRAKLDFRQMKVEEEQLILEQQTFSATPTVAERAVSELKMFYPSESNRIIIKTP